MQQPFSRTSSGHVAEQSSQFTGAASAPGMRKRAALQPVGEAVAGTVTITASPSCNPDLDLNGKALNREILEPAKISALARDRASSTIRTSS
jgi:hypothetical protein